MNRQSAWLWWVVLTVVGGMAGAAEWSGLGAGPDRVGVAPAAIALPPALSWVYRADVDQPVVSSPAVGPQGVYFCAGSKILAVDPVSGARRWEFNLGSSVFASPAVSEGRVFVGTEAGKMYALDAATGDIVWQYDATSTIHSTACVVGSVVLFGADNGNFYALSVADGGFISAYRTAGSIYSSAAYGDRTLAVIADNVVYGFRLSSEGLTKKWSRSLASGLSMATPAIAGEKALVGTGPALSAFSTSTGNLRWTKQTGGRVSGAPAVADGAVYFGSDDGVFYCVSLGTGQELWRQNFQLPIKSSPAIAGNVVFVRCQDGVVCGMDRTQNGRIVWQFKVPGTPEVRRPAAAGGPPGVPPTEVPGGAGGYSQGRRSGGGVGGYGRGSSRYGGYGGLARPTVERYFEEEIESSPAVGDGTLYFQGGNGDLYCLTADAVDVSPPVFSAAYLFIPREDKTYEPRRIAVTNVGGPMDYDVQPLDPVGGAPPVYVQLTLRDSETGVDGQSIQASVSGPDTDVSTQYFPEEEALQVQLKPPAGIGTLQNGGYTLHLSAKDFAGREGQAVLSFTVDRRVPQPQAVRTTPGYYGAPGMPPAAPGGMAF